MSPLNQAMMYSLGTMLAVGGLVFCYGYFVLGARARKQLRERQTSR